MNRTLRSIRSLGIQTAAVAGLALAAGSPVQAQWYPTARTPGNGSQLVFEWQGTVDRETQIDVGRSNVSVYGVRSNESRGRFVARGSLPRGSGTLHVQRLDGRGAIDIVQQPGTNGTGIVRIRDAQGGADRYAIRVYWQPNGGTVAGRRDGDWERDGDWDRGDRRADQLERKAERLERKAEQARRKAERRDDRDDRRDRRGWPW